MSGGKALAECVASATGSPCVGREILVEAATKIGVPESILAAKLEKGPGLWDRLTLERRLYVVAMQAALAEHAAKGDLVYHGYAGHLLLRGVPAVLRVRLIAPLEMRVRNEVTREGISYEAAEDRIRRLDEGRVRWTRAIYGVDLLDPQLYDLVVNLEAMSIPSACSIVAEAAKRPEFLITDELKASLRDFALACRVKVALATHPASRGLDLDVKAAAGLVTIGGEVPQPQWTTHTSSRWETELTEIAKTAEGVKRVLLEIRPFDAYH
ncbi:MAG: cytidylate kinase family protein [Acidobacteria bacterium]|nr:cytidylate kinase family protein [Acidobacteriota bacterium]